MELTVQGLLQRGQGWDITTSDGVGPLPGLIPETLWIRPIFQWRVHQIDAADPLWDDMAFLEVSLLKGFAFDFAVQESESYSIVIDTRFTQPRTNSALALVWTASPSKSRTPSPMWANWCWTCSVEALAQTPFH